MRMSSSHFDRITTRLRGHVAELRSLERAGAAPADLEERRAVIARLQTELAALVRSRLPPTRDPLGARP
jgi:hypothetical protein